MPKYIDQLLSSWVVSNDSDVNDRLYSTIVESMRGDITHKEDVNIRNFCQRTMTIIEAVRTRRAMRPSNAQICNDISELNSTIDNTVRKLEDIIHGRIYLSDIFGCFDEIESGSQLDESKRVLSIQQEAMQAKRSLVSLGMVLKAQEAQFPLRRGRPTVDSDRFVKALAILFRRYIGRPTTYDSGPFFCCVIIALEAVGLPHTDPSRAVINAVAEKPDG